MHMVYTDCYSYTCYLLCTNAVTVCVCDNAPWSRLSRGGAEPLLLPLVCIMCCAITWW